jgi:hypothetical protein
MRKALFSLLVLCLQYITKAQQKFPSLDFAPQSPTTAAFTRYGDIPVDLSTGVPDISIPIFTLSSHDILSGCNTRKLRLKLGCPVKMKTGWIKRTFTQIQEPVQLIRSLHFLMI